MSLLYFLSLRVFLIFMVCINSRACLLYCNGFFGYWEGGLLGKDDEIDFRAGEEAEWKNADAEAAADKNFCEAVVDQAVAVFLAVDGGDEWRPEAEKSDLAGVSMAGEDEINFIGVEPFGIVGIMRNEEDEVGGFNIFDSGAEVLKIIEKIADAAEFDFFLILLEPIGLIV